MNNFKQVAEYRVIEKQRSQPEPFAMQILVDFGIGMEHNVPCAVCGDKGAIFDLNRGVFMPCDICKKNGWSLTLVKKHWYQFWRRRA